MIENIMKYWPSQFEPRKSQKEVLQWIGSQPPEIKHFICEMPVGTGKSLIGITLSNALGGSLIFTPQKILQKQYEDTFKSLIFSLYGKKNYICKSKGTTCEVGSIIKPKCDSCPSKDAYANARNRKIVVVNYRLGLLLSLIDNDLKITTERPLFVFDECHTLETHLTELNAISISEKKCKQLKIEFKKFASDIDIFSWVKNTYLPAVEAELPKQKNMVEEIEYAVTATGGNFSKDQLSIINRYIEMQTHSKQLHELSANTPQSLFKNNVIVKEENEYKFKEIFGSNIFKKYIDFLPSKFLHMSSTILNKDEYCKDNGIDPSKAAFISIDSEFALERRPIYFIPKAKMTYGWDNDANKEQRNDALEFIAEVCNTDHKNDNGVIHTGSFAVARWLIKELDGKIPHMILHHTPSKDEETESRDIVIDSFIQETNYPKLLISPSVMEGLDLKDEKSRFQIIMKVPYPNMKDAWINKRMNISNEWYRRQAMIQIIQATGRNVRSIDDWGVTYIIDEAFWNLYKNIHSIVPEWWKDSLIKI